MKTLLKDAQTGLYYGQDHTWLQDVARAMRFSSISLAAEYAQDERLDTAEIILRYENPICELRLSRSQCSSPAPGHRSTPRRSRTEA